MRAWKSHPGAPTHHSLSKGDQVPYGSGVVPSTDDGGGEACFTSGDVIFHLTVHVGPVYALSCPPQTQIYPLLCYV